MPCRMGASFARAPRPRNPQRFSSEHGSTLTRILTRAHTHTHTHTHTRSMCARMRQARAAQRGSVARLPGPPRCLKTSPNHEAIVRGRGVRPSGNCLAASFIGDASILCVSRIIAKIQPPLRNQRPSTSPGTGTRAKRMTLFRNRYTVNCTTPCALHDSPSLSRCADRFGAEPSGGAKGPLTFRPVRVTRGPLRLRGTLCICAERFARHFPPCRLPTC